MYSGTHIAANIYCRATSSCKGDLRTVNGTGSIICSGDDSCNDYSDGYWQELSNLYCLARDTCQNMAGLIGISNIYAFGEGSLEDSIINSTGDALNSQIVSIYLGAENAGDGMKINCLGNDICAVYCLDTSLECLESIDYECIEYDNSLCAELYLGMELNDLMMSSTESNEMEPETSENGASGGDSDGASRIFSLQYVVFVVFGLNAVLLCVCNA